MKPHVVPIDLRTCHDVRHLRPCAVCAGLGDRRHMVRLGKLCYHGKCYAEARGLPELLKLPADTLGTLYLEDVGPKIMRAILDRGAVFSGKRP